MPPYPALLACTSDAARMGARLDRGLARSVRVPGRVAATARRLGVRVPVVRRVAESR